MKTKFFTIALCALMLAIASCQAPDRFTRYQINNDAQGVIEKIGNLYNATVVSNDPNVYKAEYQAGFIQSKLQKNQLLATRDNTWDNAYLTDPSHSYPKQLPPSQDELNMTQQTLAQNWNYTLDYMQKADPPKLRAQLRRLMYRLVGIYHGAVKDKPEALPFDDQWVPNFSAAEMTVGYETPNITFMDIYFINALQDLSYTLPAGTSSPVTPTPASKCSAFVKRTDSDIYMTHNSWSGFLDQSQAVTLWVNGDMMSMNVISPAILSSSTDFGYNNKGILFNETTLRWSQTQARVDALWMFWRAALAEQFSNSIDEFFQAISLEASGTYMNAYAIVDAKTNDIGYVEMSYKNFIFFKLDKQAGVVVTTKPEGINTAYDNEMVQPNVVLGINFPASMQIREDLQSTNNRPARKPQFLAHMNLVTDIETAKQLITYTDPMNPLSIYGRWDLGYGETDYPKTIPDGSVDAAAVSASMIQNVFSLKGVLDTSSTNKAFWMKFGSPYVNGKPFIWSESQWKNQKLRNVPDRIDGEYTLLNSYLR